MPGLSTATPTDFTGQAANLYKDKLGRAGDPTGIAYWANQLSSGTPADQVGKDFDTSANQTYKNYAANPQAYDAANPGISDYFKNDAGLYSAMHPQTNDTYHPTSNTDAVKNLAQGYQAAKLDVDPRSTVQYQLNNVIGSDSPLNAQATTFADQQSNKRGLLNSSIAVGAAQDALIKNALPIATQDANTYANAGTLNVNSENNARQFGANATNAESLARIQSDASMSIADKNTASAQIIAHGNNETSLAVQKLDDNSKMALANLSDTNQQLLQTNVNAADMYKQYVVNMANISASTTMGAEAKATALHNQLNALNAALQAIGEVSKLDLSRYFQANDLDTSEPISNGPIAGNKYVGPVDGTQGRGH